MTIQDVVSKSSGLVRSLYEKALSVNLHYPEYALAAALHVVSGVAARSFKWPTATAPTFYSIIVGPPGCGKNGYLQFVSRHLRAVNADLMIGKLVSQTGVLAELSRWPCRTLVQDEIGNDWLDTYSPRASETRKGIQDILLTLYGENPSINGTANRDKAKQVGTIDWPRFSIFGATTSGAMEELSHTRPFVRSGMLSRVVVWNAGEIVIPETSAAHWSLDEGAVETLKAISRLGINALEVEDGGMACKTDPDAPVSLSVDAEAVVAAWLKECAAKRRGLTAEEDEQVGQVFSRMGDMASRMAYAHCAGRFKVGHLLQVNADDATFGVNLARFHLERALQRLGHLSDEEKKVLSIQEFVAKKGRPVTAREIQQGCWAVRGKPTGEIRLLLSGMLQSGEIERSTRGSIEEFSARRSISERARERSNVRPIR